MPEGSAAPSKSGLRGRLGPIALGVAFAAVAGAGFWVLGGDGDDQLDSAIPDITAPAGSTAVPGTGSLVPERPEAGELAPDFALVDARDASQVRKLSDYFGTPIVLNWYASWCGPCEEELPVFVAAQAALGEGVQFIGVDLDEPAEKALSILDEYGVTYPALLDDGGRVSDHWRNTGIPDTFFIDADGILRVAHRGPIAPDQLAESLAAIGVTYTPRESDD